MSERRLMVPDDLRGGIKGLDFSALHDMGHGYLLNTFLDKCYSEKKQLYIEPLSLRECLDNRKKSLIDLALSNSVEPAESSLGYHTPYGSPWLEYSLEGYITGFLVPAEVRYFCRRYNELDSYPHPLDNIKQAELVFDEIEIKSQTKAQKVELSEAMDGLEKAKKDGLRTVVLIGSFDVLHAEHALLFGEAAKLAGRFGKVIALVSSNSEASLKGDGKPLYTQDERIDVMVNCNFADFIAPLLDCKSAGFDSSEDYFYFLSKQMQYDFRLVGPGEDEKLLETFRQQCAESNALLVVSDRERIMASIEIIKRARQ